MENTFLERWCHEALERSLVKTAPAYTVSNLSGPIKLESDINSDPHSAKPQVSSLS